MLTGAARSDVGAGLSAPGLVAERRRVTTTDDPYADLKRHRLTPEMARLAAMPPRRTGVPRNQRHFVRVPVLWVERLAEARHLATYRLALYLLYRSVEKRVVARLRCQTAYSRPRGSPAGPNGGRCGTSSG